jgi:hypothetical protein
VTIRHLLTHTSGLPREAMGVNWSDLTFPNRDAMIRRLPELETVFPAETEWKYSNLALSLAGEIVAAVSGEPWPRYVESHILTPLGMKSTLTLPQGGMAGLSTGYGRRVPGERRRVRPFVDVAAGGAQVLKGSTLREMRRIRWLLPDWRSGWGLGFSVRRVGEQVRAGHGGVLPGQRTQIELAPADKLGVIVLTNADDGDPVRYVDQAFALLTPVVKRAVEAPKAAGAAEPFWDRYAGTYTSEQSDVKVMVLDGKLTLVDPEAENPWEARILLKPVSAGTFRMTAASCSYGAIGELLTFETGADGRVTRMKTANEYWLRK